MAAPDIKYRGQRERQAWDLPNGLEAYVEGSIVPYYRVYRREQNPNADYSPRVAIAVRMSNAIVSNHLNTCRYLADPRRTTPTTTLTLWIK